MSSIIYSYSIVRVFRRNQIFLIDPTKFYLNLFINLILFILLLYYRLYSFFDHSNLLDPNLDRTIAANRLSSVRFESIPVI